MRFRKLRIAWSVAWGLAAVLLIVLWVRSYYRIDSFAVPTSTERELNAMAVYGQLWFSFQSSIMMPSSPRADSVKIEESEKDFWNRATSVHTTFGFGYFIRDPDYGDYNVIAPVWIAALLSVALSAIPWLPWRSKQFSLRTLLIATTLVAVGLGLIVWLAG